jgi:molybdopterin synthase catalytic subunit
MEHKIKNIFINGPVLPEKIAESIRKHSVQTAIGGHCIFLGQVRADQKENGNVQSIEYTAYVEMALEKAHEIREYVFKKFPIECLHIYHSLGEVKVGEICLFVFASAKHRKEAIDACEELVDLIKRELPVWGKEILSNEKHSWKQNTKENQPLTTRGIRN